MPANLIVIIVTVNAIINDACDDTALALASVRHHVLMVGDAHLTMHLCALDEAFFLDEQVEALRAIGARAQDLQHGAELAPMGSN